MIGRNMRSILLPATCVLLLACGTAMASSEGGESPGLFTGDVGNIIWTLVTFLAVVVVLGKFAWGPILKALQGREEFIRKSIEDAEAANKRAQEQLAEYTEQLNKSRAEASAIVEEGRRDAEVVKRTLHEEARKEAEAIITRAKREVGIARDTAVRELYDLSGALATHMAGKLISKELSVSPEDHRRLIEESIAELERMDSSKN